MVKTTFPTQITNYVMGCILLKGSFFSFFFFLFFWRVWRLSALHSNSCYTALYSCTSRSFGYSAPFPSLCLSPCFSLFFLSQLHALAVPPQFSPSRSLALFILLNVSLLTHPSFLSEKAFVAALPPCPTSGPLALSPLFSSAPPPHPASTLSALNMSLQSAAKSYKQALNYNKTMGALLSNGSVLRVTDCVCVCMRACVQVSVFVRYCRCLCVCMRVCMHVHPHRGRLFISLLEQSDWSNSISPSRYEEL